MMRSNQKRPIWSSDGDIDILLATGGNGCSSRMLVTDARHGCSSRMLVTDARHGGSSRWLVTVARHGGSSRWLVTVARHGGMIIKVAMMSMTSRPKRTHTIARGVWIIEVIFNDLPPPTK